MRLRVGLIGLGDEWESRHRSALRALSDRFEIRAVCAEVAIRAEQAAREFGATPVDGFRALIAREDIDTLLMLSPGWYGPLPILAACDAGKAIYCSAALDIEPERSREIKERVEKSGITVMAEFPRRNMPATLRLKELIATRLGPPRLLFCHQRLLVEGQTHDRRLGRHCPRAMRDMMELVDWCRYVVGHEPTSVVGVKHVGMDGNNDDYQMLSLDFSQTGVPGRGAMSQISCGHYMPSTWSEAINFRTPTALQVCCENGIAFVDLPDTVVWFDDAGRHMESLESERPVGEQLLIQFHRGVTSLIRKTFDLEDAYRAMKIVQEAKESWLDGSRRQLDF